MVLLISSVVRFFARRAKKRTTKRRKSTAANDHIWSPRNSYHLLRRIKHTHIRPAARQQRVDLIAVGHIAGPQRARAGFIAQQIAVLRQRARVVAWPCVGGGLPSV